MCKGLGEDMTSMMFQAMGVEPPLMPPTMPKSLQEHLYPHQREQRLRRFQQEQQQRQQIIDAMRARYMRGAQSNRYTSLSKTDTKSNSFPNPYSVTYRGSFKTRPSGQNTVFSPANAIRRPGVAANNAAAEKANPYSTSRAASSNLQSVRNRAIASRMQATRLSAPARLLSSYRAIKSRPKASEARMAGCKPPAESTATSILMFSSCSSRAAQFVCQSQMMTCMDAGMSAMCCPYGMNRLAMDTISYFNKLQRYVSEVA